MRSTSGVMFCSAIRAGRLNVRYSVRDFMLSPARRNFLLTGVHNKVDIIATAYYRRFDSFVRGASGMWTAVGFARATICLGLAVLATGCASMKQSDTARTGIEQLLISSATDRALEKIDLRPIAGAKVFIEEKYLDCVDKNYVLIALHQRLLRHQCTLVDKADDANVILEVASGGVGTDRTDVFVGIPEIPLPPPSPVAIPKLALFERVRSMGTAKIAIIAVDAKTKMPVVNSGYTLARADHRSINVLGFGGVSSGSVHDEIITSTGEHDSIVPAGAMLARKKRPETTTAQMPPANPSPLAMQPGYPGAPVAVR